MTRRGTRSARGTCLACGWSGQVRLDGQIREHLARNPLGETVGPCVGWIHIPDGATDRADAGQWQARRSLDLVQLIPKARCRLCGWPWEGNDRTSIPAHAAVNPFGQTVALVCLGSGRPPWGVPESTL